MCICVSISIASLGDLLKPLQLPALAESCLHCEKHSPLFLLPLRLMLMFPVPVSGVLNETKGPAREGGLAGVGAPICCTRYLPACG